MHDNKRKPRAPIANESRKNDWFVLARLVCRAGGCALRRQRVLAAALGGAPARQHRHRLDCRRRSARHCKLFFLLSIVIRFIFGTNEKIFYSKRLLIHKRARLIFALFLPNHKSHQISGAGYDVPVGQARVELLGFGSVRAADVELSVKERSGSLEFTIESGSAFQGTMCFFFFFCVFVFLCCRCCC